MARTSAQQVSPPSVFVEVLATHDPSPRYHGYTVPSQVHSLASPLDAHLSHSNHLRYINEIYLKKRLGQYCVCDLF